MTPPSLHPRRRLGHRAITALGGLLLLLPSAVARLSAASGALDAAALCETPLKNMQYKDQNDMLIRCRLTNGNISWACQGGCRCRIEQGGVQLCTAITCSPQSCEAYKAEQKCDAKHTACGKNDNAKDSSSRTSGSKPEVSGDADNATATPVPSKSKPVPTPTPSSAAAGNKDGSDDNSSGGLKGWHWAIIIVVIAAVVGGIVFTINWYKHRPKKADNLNMFRHSLQPSDDGWKELDRMDAEASDVVKDPKDPSRDSLSTTTRTARTVDTNPSTISGVSSHSYHAYGVPSNMRPADLIDTEVAVRESGVGRIFSPISDSGRSAHTSSFSSANNDIVDDSFTTSNNGSRLFSPLSENSSFSSVELRASDLEVPARPRKNSIEF
ncbi:TPA: hypothetical protein N0F65_003282 [Lagenidium giganteum]|uniref:Integral membrane protein n=1 Tax=Lagenidium giganteum TaxID=4803 RepID=A0AAV2YV37_9STRA|nr:TPA: hypothetical protein N0F65_003282 [Lagenidium giganteum]